MRALRVRADYEAGEIRRLDDTVLRMLRDTQQFLAALAPAIRGEGSWG